MAAQVQAGVAAVRSVVVVAIVLFTAGGVVLQVPLGETLLQLHLRPNLQEGGLQEQGVVGFVPGLVRLVLTGVTCGGGVMHPGFPV